jgi:AcrR family transcriptional regulator
MRAVKENESSRGQPIQRRENRTAQIYEAAARVFCENGFGQSSMADVAAAVDMTKAGVYHHIASKDELLFGIMSYGMDVFEERVLDRVEKIRDPLERLRATIRGHLLHALHGDYRTRIDRRKRRYVRFLKETFRELQQKGFIREIDPRVATFALLGMINWTYHWYNTDGRLRDTDLAEAYIDLFLSGLLSRDQPACGENDAL